MERKVATVLFADLVGSTQLGEDDPERTRALLDRFYDAMAAEVERHGGTVEKFAGDAVMAAFGAPAALEDHAERALHAALAMRERLPELSDRLQLRIGVNTGEVVVDPAAPSSFVTGDAVNVCARLEQNAEPGEILVGERTAVAVRGAFELGPAHALEVKGKSEPVACRRLVRALAVTRPRGLTALPERFVGRGRQLDALRATYAQTLAAERPHLVLVLGDAGVGKSRLVAELWGWLAQQPEQPLLRAGRCLSYGRGITYWPIREILKDHPDEVARVPILGLALGHDTSPDLHPLAARDRFREAWVALLSNAASERPVVMLVEDVHWADAPLLELLERSVRDVEGALLVVATARRDLDWTGGRRNVTALELEPLPDSDAERMVAELPDAARSFVVERAEGNPFFVEELTGSLIDRGLLVRRDDGWEARELESTLAMPDSVRGVLAARIDLLPPREKAALQAASVVGRVFWDGPVRELIVDDADFDLLVERDFVRRRPSSTIPGELEYAIKHALTRDVAYATIPRARRARLHAAFARWMEQRDEREELSALVAHHFAEAVRPEDAELAWADRAEELSELQRCALAWTRRAGELAVRRYDIESAVALFERALELEPRADRRAELWRELGRAHALRFDGERFLEAMERSLELARDRRTRAETYGELAFQTSIRSGMWRRRPEQDVVEEWADRTVELAERGSVPHVKALLARAFWTRVGTDVDAREASALAERIDDLDLRSFAWGARATTAFAEGRFEEALSWAQRRLDVVSRISDPDHVSDIYDHLIAAASAVGHVREARRLALENKAFVANLSAHHRVHGVSNLLEVDELSGAYDRICAVRPEVEEAVDANLDTPCIRNARSLLTSAVAAEIGGDSVEAARLESRANDVATEGYGPILAAPRAMLALVRGRLDQLEGSVPPFREWRGQTWFSLSAGSVRLDALAALGDRATVEREAPPLVRVRSYLQPFALRALGRLREDEELVRQAIAVFESMGLDWHAEQTRAYL